VGRIHAAVDVDAPIQSVFDKYVQYDRHPEWQPGLLRAELTSGPNVAPGTRGIEVRRLFGREMSFPYVITEHVAPHRSAFQTLEGPGQISSGSRCGSRRSFGQTAAELPSLRLHK